MARCLRASPTVIYVAGFVGMGADRLDRHKMQVALDGESAQRYSIATFCPSAYPVSASPSRKTARFKTAYLRSGDDAPSTLITHRLPLVGMCCEWP